MADKQYQNGVGKQVHNGSLDITACLPTLALFKGKIDKGFGPSSLHPVGGEVNGPGDITAGHPASSLPKSMTPYEAKPNRGERN